MDLFRIHIRPGGGIIDMQMTFDYCLRNNFLGIGWRTNPPINNTTVWKDYSEAASQLYNNQELQGCMYIHTQIHEGDLVWTRNANGQYYLASVQSGWEYWINQEAIDNDIDIANIFRCVLKEVRIDAVPGKIVACFRARRSIQRIADNAAKEYSKYLWNNLSDTQVYEYDNTVVPLDIFAMLDDEETEDLLFLYLQSKGWYVVPNSRKANTMSFEYLLVNPQDNTKALVQVKTGQATINKDTYIGFNETIFLFQPNNRYIGNGAENIVCVLREKLLKFLNDSLDWLPEFFRIKVELVNKCNENRKKAIKKPTS